MPNLEFDLPKNRSNIIKVLGVGGGGSNAVSYMYKQGIRDVDFIVCNTDAQSLELSPVPTKIQLGSKGLGAGSVPDVGRESTRENIEQIKETLQVNTKMLFITAGMGGGTGTGGAPVIAQAARELDILTVGIVTMPFMFEGRKRRLQAEAGIAEMRKYVDTLLVINNDKLRELYGDLKLSQAFHQADDVLTTAAKGIAEIVTVPGYVNVDFEDVNTVMKNSGKAIMGSAIADGENRALLAVENALSSPLLDDSNIKGADDILLYITSGTEEISMDEVSEITDYIQNEAGQNAEILWGNGTDESLGDKICVTIIATGFDSKKKSDSTAGKKIIGTLDETNNKPTHEEPEKHPVDESQEIKLKTKDEDEKPATKESPRVFTFDFGTPGNANDAKNEVRSVKPTETNQQEQDKLKPEQTQEKAFITVRKPAVENHPPIENNNMQQKQAQDRIQRLKDLSLKLRTSGGLAELEKEPAYIRKKMELKDPPPSTGQQTSRYTLSSDDENNTDIRTNNSFLHDNVD
jgi:cell division protein FtsZ